MQLGKYNRTTAGRRRPSKHKWALLALLLLAAILRFQAIGEKSLWLDEIMTVQKASMPYGRMIAAIKQHDAHPPLFQTVEWLWLLLGHGDGFARIPSAIAGVASVWLVYLIARRLLSRRAALIAAALMTVSYFHIYYSQEARLHSLVVAIVLAQTYVLIRILHQRGKARWGWWAAYCLIALASLYTYALCILTIAALGLAYIILAWKRRRIQLAHFIIAHLLIALVFLPWYPTLRRTTARVRASVKALGDEQPPPTVEDALDGTAAWALGPLPWRSVRPTGAAVGGALIAVAGAGLLIRRPKRPAKILAVLFLLPLIAYILMPIPRVQRYDPKHLVFLQPVLIIALAGFRLPFRRSRSGAAVASLAVSLVALNIWLLADFYSKDFQKENWPAVVRDVRSRWRDGDALLFNPELMGAAFEYYLPQNERALARQRALLGAPLNPEIRRRIRLQYPQRKIPPLSPAVRRVWLIECKNHITPHRAVYRLLYEAGFVGNEDDSRRYDGHLGYVQWRLFTRGPRPPKATQP